MSDILHIATRRLVRSGVLVIGIAIAAIAGGIASAAAATRAEHSFASPDTAVAALNAALASGDQAQILAVLGPDAKRLLSSGDAVADQNGRKAFLAGYAAKHSLEPQGDAREVLVIGDNDWPFPIPIVRVGSAWRFDTAAGAQELIDRRIGRNELATIRTLLAVVAAQKDYFERSKAGGNAGAYARHFMSTKGKTDGLYWVAKPDEPGSPLAALVQDAESEGYLRATDRGGRPQPYHGYLFRMLTAQGPEAPGGARTYLVKGQMAGGFAVLAWPAQFGNSGIVSFEVNQDGSVFQKDLGPGTARAAAGITRFNPDVTWARVDLKEE